MSDLDHILQKFAGILVRLKEYDLKSSEVKHDVLRGGLTASHGYAVDRYITYKTGAGDAVALTVLAESKDSPLFLQLWRRRTDGRAMPTISVDVIPINEIDAAGDLFIAVCKVISAVPRSWRPAAAGATEK